MLKKISIYIVLSTFIISCNNESKEPKPSLSSFPQVSLTQQKVVQSVGFTFDTNNVVITNSFTGEDVKSCGKTNIGDPSKKPTYTNEPDSNCAVKILDVEENQAFIEIQKNINSFNQPVLIEKDGKLQTTSANIVTIIKYDGSCGSLTSTGGDQHESEVDCFSTQAQDCARWVENGWTFVKDYPPCYEFYH